MTQILFQYAINTLSLTISLRVKRRTHFVLDTQHADQSRPEIARKASIPITDDA